MSTNFDTSFSQGDIVLPSYVKQYAQPINDLESGASFYRQATDSSGAYLVDFRSATNPGGHSISSLTEGQVLVFKASHDCPSGATITVETDLGTVSNVPIYHGDQQVGQGLIASDQMVTVVYNNTTTPRFDILGLQGSITLDDLSGCTVSSPASGEVLRHNGTEFENAQLEIDDVKDLNASLASAGGSPTGNLADIQALNLSQGDMLIADSGGQFTKLPAGNNGQILKLSSGNPTWIDDAGGASNPGLYLDGLVAYGYHYEEITSTSTVLRTSGFIPQVGETYLISYLSNHTSSVSSLNLPSARSNGQDHYCRAEETGSSTVHNIGFSGSGGGNYDCAIVQRCRPIEFFWTATTSNEVEIALGQPTLSYGEFTGTLHVYKLRPEVSVLGWGKYRAGGNSWLEDTQNWGTSVGSGAYKSGFSLDATKTYCFIGQWTHGFTVTLCLKQGTDYWRLPPDSNTFEVVTSTQQSAWAGSTYFEQNQANVKGNLVRYFTPPSTGTFEIGVALFDVRDCAFLLLEV